MFYHFLYPLSQEFGGFNIFRYITFRSLVGFLVATVVSIWWGKYFVVFMRSRQFGQTIREVGPRAHLKKEGTPTMGGIFLLGTVFLTILMMGNFNSIPLCAVIIVGGSFFLLGLFDDYLKVLRKDSDGISVKGKLFWQFATSLGVGLWLIEAGGMDTSLHVPFVKEPIVDLGYFYLVFMSLVVVGSSNAVNLTDGLDGLAIVPIIISVGTLGILTYAAGHHEFARYLYIPYGEGLGELAVLSSSIIGAGMGFLWYNSYPAQIFMGDVGSLSLGGILGMMAVISKNELLFFVVGGVFVVEAVSVIIQVGFFKWKKMRVFKMAPIHHHFELSGWSEPKVIVRFWIISLFLALLSLATLKIR